MDSYHPFSHMSGKFSDIYCGARTEDVNIYNYKLCSNIIIMYYYCFSDNICMYKYVYIHECVCVFPLLFTSISDRLQ